MMSIEKIAALFRPKPAQAEGRIVDSGTVAAQAGLRREQDPVPAKTARKPRKAKSQ
jgi:hypothetical protein